MSGSVVQFVPNIASLRQAGVPTANAVFYVEGYSSLNDGGGGTFIWNSASSAIDDAGSVIRPNSLPASGRWLRQAADTVNVLMFGALCDGSTDDTAAVQNAINSLPASGGTVVFPSKSTRIAGNLTIGNGSGPNGTSSTKQGVRLKGAGVGWNPGYNSNSNLVGSTLLCTGSGYALTVNGPQTGFAIEDIAFQSTSSGGTASGINLEGLQFGYFRNLAISNFPGSSLTLTQCYKCIFDNIFIYLQSGSANANGVLWNTNTAYGSFSNAWRGLRVTLTNTSQNALIFGAVDSEYLISTEIMGSGVAIAFVYSNSSGSTFPCNVSFFGLDPYGNYVGNNGTPGPNTSSNYIWNFSTVNGSKTPNIANLTVIY